MAEMPFHRMRRRRSRPRGRTYKKVLNFAPVSAGAGIQQDILLAVGTDSTAIGQVSPTDAVVPTGSKIAWFEIQYTVANLAAVFCHVNITIQNLLAGQVSISPILVGGNTQRNQVMHQGSRAIGQGQNMTWNVRYRVPPKMQRMREGSAWLFNTVGNVAVSQAVQIIYKVEL